MAGEKENANFLQPNTDCIFMQFAIDIHIV